MMSIATIPFYTETSETNRSWRWLWHISSERAVGDTTAPKGYNISALYQDPEGFSTGISAEAKYR